MSDEVQLLEDAKREYKVGHFGQVCDLARRVLQINSDNGLALELLGVCSGQLGDLDEAVASLERAAVLRPADIGVLSNLGAVYRKAGRIGDAESCLEKAISLQPDAVSPHFNLANLYAESGRLGDAVRHYQAVLIRDARHAGTLNNIAALLKSQGLYSEAEDAYRRLMASSPEDAAVRSNLGALLVELGRTEEAIALYRQSIALEPNAAAPRNNLGLAYIETSDYEAAIQCLLDAADLNPRMAEIHENLGNAYRKTGAVDEAAACYDAAISLSGSAGARFKRATLLPVVASSEEALRSSHAAMVQAIKELVKSPPVLRDPNAEVGVTMFNLSYHDTNNRDVQADLARAYVQACPDLGYRAPHCREVRRQGNRRAKVGFLSRQFGTNAVGWCFHGVLRHMPSPDVEVVAIRIGSSDDPLWRAICADVDNAVEVPVRLEAARKEIAELQLDALIYTDIGMEPLSYFLAHARLAPLQCVLGGHPDTLGISEIDYYISSDLQEPPDAEDHYSEKLVRLPGAPTYYDRPEVPSPLKPRSAFGLPDEGAIYFCAQTLIKIHPEMDRLFAGILESDDTGHILLPGGYNAALVDLLKRRFERTLAPHADRVSFLPAVSHTDFMNVMALADVSLDTRPFGGGNTSWQAIATGTPIVTWPGKYLRGRYTQALYRLMGLEDLICDSADAYIASAIGIARDRARRDEIARRIEAGAEAVFSDMVHVDALRREILRLLDGQS